MKRLPLVLNPKLYKSIQSDSIVKVIKSTILLTKRELWSSSLFTFWVDTYRIIISPLLAP